MGLGSTISPRKSPTRHKWTLIHVRLFMVTVLVKGGASLIRFNQGRRRRAFPYRAYVIVSGDHAVVLWVYRKVRNGVPWHLRGVDAFTVRDGKVPWFEPIPVLASAALNACGTFYGIVTRWFFCVIRSATAMRHGRG